MIVALDNISHYEQLINTYKICILDFYASWCKPCKLLATDFETYCMSQSVWNDDIVIIKIDVDRFADLADLYKVNELPFVAIVVNSELNPRFFTGYEPNTVNEIFEYVECIISANK